KAILAFSDPGVLDATLSGPLEALTPKTITDPDSLRAELARVREQRVAYDLEESETGLFCLAAPILDARGHAIGAISVTGATAQAQAERYGPAVRTTALAIARALHPRH